MAIDLFCHPIKSLPDFKFVYFRNLRVQKIKNKNKKGNVAKESDSVRGWRHIWTTHL